MVHMRLQKLGVGASTAAALEAENGCILWWRSQSNKIGGSGPVWISPSHDGVILSLRRIWRAADMHLCRSCGSAREILQNWSPSGWRRSSIFIRT